LAIPRRVCERDAPEARAEVFLDDGKDSLFRHGTLEAAAERRLDGDLHGAAGRGGFLRRGDNPARRFRRVHTGVFPAMRVARGHAEADERDTAEERAVEAFLVQDEARQDALPRRPRTELKEQLVRVGHLRDLFRVDERPDLHDVDARVEEALDPHALRRGGNDVLLNLEAVARPDFMEDEAAHCDLPAAIVTAGRSAPY
jgi:hypothetical protein